MKEHSVLIIDDDIWMQRILSKTLQSYGFKPAYLASNGFDGIALAVEHEPSLIILDILMPELSGHISLKILKKIKATRDIPVLMVSALSDVENLGLAVKSGTAGFISKPFTKATIYEKLVNIYGREALDMIKRGEDVDTETQFYGDDVIKTPFQQPENRISGIDNEDVSSEPSAKDSDKPKVDKGRLLQHYQEDEKKNIESIKKLLLKTKK